MTYLTCIFSIFFSSSNLIIISVLVFKISLNVLKYLSIGNFSSKQAWVPDALRQGQADVVNNVTQAVSAKVDSIRKILVIMLILIC